MQMLAANVLMRTACRALDTAKSKGLCLLQGTDRGMTSEQVQDRQVAIKMAHQACMADKLELHAP